MKSIKALFVLALMATLAVPAFAETQNVKVSGSLDAYYFNRTNYDLTRGNDSSVVPAGTAVIAPGAAGAAVGNLNNRSDSDNYFRSNTQIQVAANLTDNVSTVINLVNQRDWNADTLGASTGAGANNTANEFSVDLDLAYVQMKEIFYAPLTLTVGRQDLWFGRGFIIGNNNNAWDANTSVSANEYSVTTAFDAIRATLDFNPWTIDFAYSNVIQNSVNAEDNIDLWIANVNYKFAEYNAVAEGYFVSEQDRATLSANAALGTDNNATDTIGVRVQFDPISQITLGAELAYQSGDYSAVVAQQRNRSAMAADIFGTYRFDNAWKPEVTLEYVHFSGEEDLSNTSTADYSGWNLLYRGKFWTAYEDFREVAYATGDALDQGGSTNSNMFQIKGSLKPMEDLLLEAAASFFWTDEDIHVGANTLTSAAFTATGVRNNDIGWETDLQATYDYTEDVSFGLLAAWFVPGDFYTSPNDSTATDIVSSIKVSF